MMQIPVQMPVEQIPMQPMYPEPIQFDFVGGPSMQGDYTITGARFGSERQGDAEGQPQKLSLRRVEVSGGRFGGPLDHFNMQPAFEMQPLASVTALSVRPADSIDPRNLAVMISLAGYIFSVGLICWASVAEFVYPQSPDSMYAQGWATQMLTKGKEQRGVNLGWGVTWLFLGCALMTISQFVIRKIIVWRLNLADLIAAKASIAVAIFEAGMQVSLGLVAAAAISGPPSPDGFGVDLLGFVLFYALSFVLLVAWTWVFDRYTSDWSTWAELKKGNEAVAVCIFCQMVCSAMLMSNAVSKSFELATFFGWFATGTVVRLIFRSLLDHMVVAPKLFGWRYTHDQLRIDRLIKKNNWGTAVVVGWLQIVVTRIINTFLPAFCWEFVYSDGSTQIDMRFGEKLVATEYIFTVWHWDRLVALCCVFLLFVLVRFPFELRMKLQLAGARIGQAADAPAVETALNYYIFENKLNAVNLSFGAFLVAVGNFMCGVFVDEDYRVSFAALDNPGAWGVVMLQILVGCVMTLVSLMVNDIFVLHKYKNMVEMACNDNKAVALIEAGSLIGSSFIIEACVKGWDYSDPPFGSAIILFLVTQVLIVLFQLVFESATAYNDEQEVAIGNSAAGILLP